MRVIKIPSLCDFHLCGHFLGRFPALTVLKGDVRETAFVAMISAGLGNDLYRAVSLVLQRSYRM